MKDADLSQARGFYLVGLIAYGVCAIYQTVMTLDAYDGPEANSRAWRIIGILSIAGIPSLFPLTGLLGDPAAAPSWIYLVSSACGFLQIVVIVIVALMVNFAKPKTALEDPGRKSDP